MTDYKKPEYKLTVVSGYFPYGSALTAVRTDGTEALGRCVISWGVDGVSRRANTDDAVKRFRQHWAIVMRGVDLLDEIDYVHNDDFSLAIKQF